MTQSFKIEDTEIPITLSELENESLVVRSVPFNYEVNFVSVETLQQNLGQIKNKNKAKHFILADQNVAALYTDKYLANSEVMTLEAMEENKVLPVVTTVLDKLQEKNITKNELFLTIGGGVIQDISAFARAVYKRGINWVYVPTTLLSMADSCIGAKSCLNYGGVKNQLGLFSAPKNIYICKDFLNTLPDNEILSGYGEMIKLAIVGGQGVIDEFLNLTAPQQGDRLQNIEKLIKLALMVKKSVIEIDEYESDIRKALNYGHTIGHAIEPLVDYKIPHGIAISIGIIIENLLSSAFGNLSENEADYLNNIVLNFIDKASLDLLKTIPMDALIDNMMRDKKAITEDIYLAVPFNIGRFSILKIKVDTAFKSFLAQAINNLSA